VIIASVFSSIIGPFADAFGWLLAAFFSFTHSYGWSIVLLTLTAMVVVFPLTRAGTRSMMRMQLLQPELLKIRNRYKPQPGMTGEEKQAARVKLNEEMMALYRENDINPTGGCLPMFLQFPIFIVLYNVIRGMTREVTLPGSKTPVLRPQYIPKHTALYHAVQHANGSLRSFGLNLADSVRTPGPFSHKVPYIAVILIAVILQYISIWQITNRNPQAAQANAQMQAVQKFMPLIFVFIYIVLPAGVGVYFIVSNLFRIGQQEYMYKHDPKIVATMQELRKRRPIEAKASDAATGRKVAEGNGARRGLFDRLRAAAAGFATAGETEDGDGSNPTVPGERPSGSGRRSGPSSRGGSNGSKAPGPNGSRPAGSKGGKNPGTSRSSGANRSRDKRRRRS
jgi:YidC/Oxa1 family membrane protein insertase